MNKKTVNYQDMANSDISQSISHMNVHDHLKENSVEQNQELCRADRKRFGVCVLNVTGELNVGTIVRNAHLTGAKKVGILGRKKYDKRGCVGAEKYFDVERIDALNQDGITIDTNVFWSWVDANNFTPVFCETGGTLLHKVNWVDWVQAAHPKDICLIFGNENRGIQEDILSSRRDRIISIGQLGVIRSYNVGTASGIVMYDLVRSMRWL